VVGLLGVYLYRLRRRPVRRLVVGGYVSGSVVGRVFVLTLVLMLLSVVLVVVVVVVVVLGEGLGDVGGYYRFPLLRCSRMGVVAATAVIGASSLYSCRGTMPCCDQS